MMMHKLKNLLKKESVADLMSNRPKSEFQDIPLKESAFTRTHYKQIAAVLKNAESVEEVSEQLIAIFKADNPRFNEDAFRSAAAPDLKRSKDPIWEEFDIWTCMECHYRSPKRFSRCPKCGSGEVENLG